MESKKGYYIDIVGGTVKTAEEIEIETACKNATALVELSQLKSLLNEYFCLFLNRTRTLKNWHMKFHCVSRALITLLIC